MREQSESIKDFCSRIEQDSGKEVSSILERADYTAKARAERILEDAEEKRKAILDQAADESESARRVILSDLNLELKKVGLRVRGDIIEEAMAMLKRKLEEYRSSSEYAEFVTKLALEGIAVLGEGEVVLKPGDIDREIFTGKLLDKIRSRAKELLGGEISITLGKDTIKGQAGLHVVSKAGNVLFDNTIDSRLDRMGDDLRLLTARNIFG